MVLSSMLWDVVEAFLAGGEEAPSVPMLILAIVLLGGGTIFSAIQTYRTWKALSEEDRQKAEEARKKAEMEQQTEELPEAEE